MKRPLVIISGILLLAWGATTHGAVKGADKSSAGGGENVIQSSGQTGAPKGTPTWEIQEIERKMEAYETSKDLSPAQRAKNRKLKRDILTGAFDLGELSRLALDGHWGKISSAEQGRFVGLMQSLLETKAIFSKEQSKAQGKTYRIAYKGDKFFDKNNRSSVLTEIFIPKDNVRIDINYKLKKKGSRWMVYDIIVDNASLLENYKFQFDRIIKKYGYGELVKRMQKKLQEIRTQQ